MRDGVTLGTAMRRGFIRKCPRCGQAPAFRGYLKIAAACSNCGAPLNVYPTDDGPAYLTMLVIGHLVIAPAFMLGFFYTYPTPILLIVLLSVIALLTLAALPVIKGAFLGLMWYLGLKSSRQ